MSEVTQVNATSNQSQFNYDTSKIFIFENQFQKETFINISGGPLEYKAGTLVGRITTGGNITALASSAADGSNIPVGILAQDTGTLADDGTVEVYICVSGEVAQEKVLLQGSDTLDTAISGRPIKDRIGADTVGIKLIAGTEMTAFDNQ